MSLRWYLNENPVSSEKMNQLSVIKLTEVERDGFTAAIEGMMIYNLTKHRFEYWDGTTWKPFGGGSMLNMIGYKRYGSFDSNAGYFLQFTTNAGRSANGSSRWLGNLSPVTFKDPNITLTSSAEHTLYSNTFDLGRAVSKVYATFPCVIGAVYSNTQPVITITLDSIKFEVLDGTTVIASSTFTANRSYTRINNTTIYAGHLVSTIVDVGDKDISDFRFKVTVNSSVSPSTDLLEHRHYWYADSKDIEPTESEFHPLELQVLLL